MNAIFGDQFYRRYILELFKILCRLRVLRICFFNFFPDTFYTWNALFGHSNGRTYKAQLSSKSRRTEAVFHLNNRLNAPLNLKEI